MFGEYGLLNNSKRSATILAIQPCQLLVVQKQYYEEFIKDIETLQY